MRALVAVVLVGLLTPPLDVAAQGVRDEAVELLSGDRVTGEILGLDRSYLTVDTNDVGTVQIRWQRVVRLNSNRMLAIVLAHLGRIIGRNTSHPVAKRRRRCAPKRLGGPACRCQQVSPSKRAP